MINKLVRDSPFGVKQIAQYAGISHATLLLILHDRLKISPMVAIRLSRALDTSPEHILIMQMCQELNRARDTLPEHRTFLGKETVRTLFYKHCQRRNKTIKDISIEYRISLIRLINIVYAKRHTKKELLILHSIFPLVELYMWQKVSNQS